MWDFIHTCILNNFCVLNCTRESLYRHTMWQWYAAKSKEMNMCGMCQWPLAHVGTWDLLATNDWRSHLLVWSIWVQGIIWDQFRNIQAQWSQGIIRELLYWWIELHRAIRTWLWYHVERERQSILYISMYQTVQDQYIYVHQTV